MRKILATAVIAATCVVATSAFAAKKHAAMPTTHEIAGPVKMGKMCWGYTDSNGVYGFWRACPKAAKAMKMSKKAKKMKS